jgi:hypothetical protein
VKISLLLRRGLTGGILALLVSCNKPPTANNSQASLNGPTPVDYSKRIGVAVRTDSRTCVAIKDATLQPRSAITLVLPLSPQSFVDAQISGPDRNVCPISEEVAPGVTSYELSIPAAVAIPKLTPLIAVSGMSAAGGFVLDNLNVQADIDQTHAKNTFRACGASDGVHLTVWRGIPINGTLLWSGHYYESGSPGSLPTCTAAETSPLAPKS